MNNRLAMCLVGPVQLVLQELKPQPRLWDLLVAQLRRLPEFVEASEQTVLLRSRLVHRFTPAACPPFAGCLIARWAVIVTVSGQECLGLLGTQFHDRDHEYEWPTGLPLAQFDPFMPLVDDLEAFLGRLHLVLSALASHREEPATPPVLSLESLGVSAN